MSLKSAAAIALWLLVPVLCFQQWRPGFQLPGARSGDEPHYLVMAYSLAHDGDLLVDDDYATPRFADPRDQARADQRTTAARAAAPYQQGLYLSDFPLSHHSNLIANNDLSFLRWDTVYEFRERQPGEISGEASKAHSATVLDRFEVVRRPEHTQLESKLSGGYREIAWHPPGYPILLAITGWPVLRLGPAWTELWMIALQIALFACALLCARRLAGSSTQSGRTGLTTTLRTAAVGLCFAAGYYAATLYTEAVTPALCVIALYGFARRRLLLCSAMLGLLFFIKESHAPLAVIFAVCAWLRDRRPADGLRVLSFPALAFGLFILRNVLTYGTPLQTYYPWMTNPDIPAGVLGLLGDARTGVLVFSPCMLLALYGLRRLARARRQPWLVAVILASCAYFFALSAATVHWSGGPSYAYRLLVPAVAMLLPGAFAWLDELRTRRRLARFRQAQGKKDKPGKQSTTYAGQQPALLLAGLLSALLFGVSFVNGFFAITNLAYAYDADAYINLLEPQRSGLARRLFAE